MQGLRWRRQACHPNMAALAAACLAKVGRVAVDVQGELIHLTDDQSVQVPNLLLGFIINGQHR